MKMTRTWIGWTLRVLCLCGTLSAAGAASDAVGSTRAALGVTDRSGGLERGDGSGERHHARPGAERRGALRLLRRLDLSDDQCGLALQESRSARAIVEQARREAARILIEAEDAGNGARSDDVRARLESLRQETSAKLAPLARQVLATLTPEQHRRIEEHAARRGRSFDEQRLVRRLSFLLARPMTTALLEARLDR